MGIYGCSPNVTAYIAGIFTLLQGLAWTVIAVLALLVLSCTIYISEETLLIYRIYLVYLYNGTNATRITQVSIQIYLILSLLWVLTALFLLIATVTEAKGSRGLMLRVPWLVITTIFLILDVITSVLYSIDISSTTHFSDLLAFVGAQIPDSISSSSTTAIFESLTMGASIVALLIFSRAAIGWVFNLVMLVHVAQDIREAEKSPPAPLPEPRLPYEQYLRKLSTVGPVPDAKWDPYQRKRSDLPVIKPLRVPSPPNERKRKMSDYQKYLFYAKQPPGQNYLDDIISEPPTPAVDKITMEPWAKRSFNAAGMLDDSTSFIRGESTMGPPVPEPDYNEPGHSISATVERSAQVPSRKSTVY